MRIRVLELGSNSFRLCGFVVSERGSVLKLWNLKEFVRLSADLGERRILPHSAIRRALAAVQQLLRSSEDHAPLLTVATSAIRTAQNRHELLGALGERCGLQVRVLSGLEEARLAYAGARAHLALGGQALRGQARKGQRLAVIDIGGGSTELAVGDAHGLSLCRSVRLGTLGTAGLSRSALGAVLDARLSGAIGTLGQLRPERLVFTCGVARAVAKLLHRSAVLADPRTVPADVLREHLTTIAALRPSALRALGVSPWRHPTLGIGARLLSEVTDRLAFSHFHAAWQGLREGVALWSWTATGRRHPAAEVAAAIAPLAASPSGGDDSGVQSLAARATG